EQAAKSAIQERLEEMDRAQELQREPPPQEPLADPEPLEPDDVLERLLAQVPEDGKRWFREHSEYLFEPVKIQAAQHFHNVTMAELGAGKEFSPEYFRRMEFHLGLRQPEAEPQPEPQPQQGERLNGRAPVSAPVSREAPSMTTGRTADPTK